MNFGQAIEAMKTGRDVARAGWNGKNMYIWINWGSSNLIGQENLEMIENMKRSLFVYDNRDDQPTTLPNINMRSATGSIVTGWLASQTDILSEDWEVVNEIKN